MYLGSIKGVNLRMRLFVAINFNDETRNRLIRIKDELWKNSEQGNFTLPENLHLTLAFLGECNVKQTADAKAALDMISFDYFDLEIERVGCFKRNDGDLWWAGVKECEYLTQLQQNLTDKLRLAGFTVEKRKFSPHITIGRKVVTGEKARLVEPFGETVSKVELMESKRINGKLTYVPIHEREAINNEFQK